MKHLRMFILNLVYWKTHITLDHQDFVGFIKVTKCCKVGPITTENYCPNCGKYIIKE